MLEARFEGLALAASRWYGLFVPCLVILAGRKTKGLHDQARTISRPGGVEAGHREGVCLGGAVVRPSGAGLLRR